MIVVYPEWEHLADIIDENDISRFLDGFFRSARTEEEFGRWYLQELRMKYPEYSNHINGLIIMPGIGAYVTHWFLEQGGALCR